MPVYYNLVYSHLQYAIINRGNYAKSCVYKLQVRQNRVVKILRKRCDRKTRLLSLHLKLQFLRINEIYKFMIKTNSNKLPVMGDEEFKFTKVSSIHFYPT